MDIKANQLQAAVQARDRNFLGRLDALLLPHSAVYAAAPEAQRAQALAKVAAQAREWGILEELNIGLFALLALLLGAAHLHQPEPMAILRDPDRSGTAKAYQLWSWYRQRYPQAPIFAAAAA